MTLQTDASSHVTALPLSTPHGIAAASFDAPLTFLTPGNDKPVTYMPPPEGGEVRRTGQYAQIPVTIHNGRAVARNLSLDREGFLLTHHDTALEDFLDDDQIKTTYYPEMAELVKQATGASEVLVFDHNVRVDGGPERDDRDDQGVRAPVRIVHNDYTAKSGARRLRDLIGDEAAGPALAKGVAVINVWRPIAHPVESAPLALADAQSILPQDLIKLDLVYPERIGEIYNGRHSPAHRWYSFPKMAPDEAILIKGYDSRDDGRARFTLHTAFDDPTAPKGARPRQSIEVRTMAFFDD